MNEQADIGRVLRHWFQDGPDSMPDRVVDTVAARISVNRQRRMVHLVGRTAPVNRTLTYIAAAAAVVIAAVAIWQFLPANPASSGGQPTPSPTTAPTALAVRDVRGSETSLDPGRWRFRPFDDIPSLSVVAAIPDGWRPIGQWGVENIRATNSPPSGLAIVFNKSERGVFSDACHWDVDGTGTIGEGDVKVGPTVGDLVDALRANTSYTSSTPSPIAFGPYQGQRIEIQLPADLDPATCDQPADDDEGRFFVMPDNIYSQGPSNIWRMSIVDVAGTRFVAIIEYFPGTAPDKLAEAQAIVDSLELTP